MEPDEEKAGDAPPTSSAPPRCLEVALVPPAFPLLNVGAICHFNSLLQGMASCPAAVRTARDAEIGTYLERTKTGRALRAFLAAAPHPDPGASVRVLAALLADLQERKPDVLKHFGPGQQSACEGLTLLIEMTDEVISEAAPDSDDARAARGAALQEISFRNPFARLFFNRYQDTIICRVCGGMKEIPSETGTAIMTHREQEGAEPKEFALGFGRHAHAVEWDCPACGVRRAAGQVHNLKRVGEIIVMQRDVYKKRAPLGDFPPVFTLPGAVPQRYRRVAVLDHSGSMTSGHYNARALRRFKRADGKFSLGPYRLNDASVLPGTVGDAAGADGLAIGAGTYLVFYHRL